MDIKDKLYPADLKAQVDSAVGELNKENIDLKTVIIRYTDLANCNDLQGDAAYGLKQQAIDYVTIYNACVSANDCDIADYKTLKASVGDQVLDGEEIDKGKKDAQARKSSAESSAQSAWNDYNNTWPIFFITRAHYKRKAENYEDQAQDCQDEYDEYVRLEGVFDSINAATSSLFTSGTLFREVAMNGFRDCALNFDGGQYTYQSSSTWRDDFVKLYSAEIANLKEQWKKEDGTYDMDALEVVLSGDENSISYTECLALCEVFDEMSEKQKAELIGRAYIADPVFHPYEGYTNMYGEPFSDAPGFWEYHISGAFQAFTAVYGSKLPVNGATVSENDRERIANYSFLAAAAFMKPTVQLFNLYNYGNEFEGVTVSIDRQEGSTEKYDMSISGSGSYMYDGKEWHTTDTVNYTIWGYTSNMDVPFDEAVEHKIDQLRPSLFGDLTGTAISTAAGAGACFVFTNPVSGAVATGVMAVPGTIVTIFDDIETNKKIDSIQDAIDASNAMTALGVHGTVIMDSEGNYMLPYTNCDYEAANQAISDYNNMSSTTTQIGQSAESLVRDLQNGAAPSDALMDFTGVQSQK